MAKINLIVVNLILFTGLWASNNDLPQSEDSEVVKLESAQVSWTVEENQVGEERMAGILDEKEKCLLLMLSVFSSLGAGIPASSFNLPLESIR